MSTMERHQKTLDPQHSISRRLRALSTTSDEAARAAWKDRIEALHVDDDVAKRAASVFDGVIHRAQKSGGEARCVVLHGESGAGKSHILQQFGRRERLQASRDEQGLMRPLVMVKAPAPCTLKSLLRVIFAEMAGPDEKIPWQASAADIWLRLAPKLYGQCVSILVIDEFHHALSGSKKSDQIALVNTLKSLLIPDPQSSFFPAVDGSYPLQIIVSGIPIIDSVIMQDPQLALRRVALKLEPLLETAEGLKYMKRFLKLVESCLGFPEKSPLDTDDVVRRFMRATAGYRGRAMRLLKDASFLAIDRGASHVDPFIHLAEVYESTFACGGAKNPFMVADVSKCPKAPDWDDAAPLTRLHSRARRNDANIASER